MLALMQRSKKILVGKNEICEFSRFGKGLFPELIRLGFPAVFWGGAWRAHVDNIDAWLKWVTVPGRPQKDVPEDWG